MAQGMPRVRNRVLLIALLMLVLIFYGLAMVRMSQTQRPTLRQHFFLVGTVDAAHKASEKL